MGSLISEAYVGGVVNNAAITTAQVFPNPSSLNTVVIPTVEGPAILAIPGSNKVNGKYFDVHVAGNVAVGGVTPSVSLILYAGAAIPTLAAPGTAVATLAAATLVTATTYPFYMHARFEGDTASGILQGYFSTLMNGVFTAYAKTVNLTGIAFGPTGTPSNPIANEPALNMCFGLTFGVANAANSAVLTQFGCEA
jgi:hypothetical protein